MVPTEYPFKPPSFMPTSPNGALGSLEYKKEERRSLAIKSRAAATKKSHDQSEPKLRGANYCCFGLLQTDYYSTSEGSFRLVSENPPKPKRLRSDNKGPSSSNISFRQPSPSVPTSFIKELDPKAMLGLSTISSSFKLALTNPIQISGPSQESQDPPPFNRSISIDPISQRSAGIH